MKVAIFGMGISGLSASHELAEAGHDVDIYEVLPEIGGVARSYRETPTDAPSQYSYRGYGPWYHNAFDMMKQIPTEDGKTVYDNLTRPIQFVFTEDMNYFVSALSLKDKSIIAIEVMKIMSAGEGRKAEYATINSAEYMKPKLSKKGWELYISMFGPWVGIDPQRASHFHVMDFIRKSITPNGPTYMFEDEDSEWIVKGFSGWLVFNQPENEAWFFPWMKYLKTLNVKFHFNTELYSLKCDKETGLIGSVQVKHNDELQVVTADNYVIAISPFGMTEVLKNTIQTDPDVSPILVDEYHRYLGLTQDGMHTQVSFRLGFDEKYTWEKERIAMVISTSEFNITIYRQDEMWERGIQLGPSIKSLWSGTACISYVPGSLFNKPVTDCTREEFTKEIMHQLSKDQLFNEMLRKQNGKSFEEMLPSMIHFEIWKNWKFDED